MKQVSLVVQMVIVTFTWPLDIIFWQWHVLHALPRYPVRWLQLEHLHLVEHGLKESWNIT